MKNILCALGFLLMVAGASAQTKNNKLGITTGFGMQQYKGDLGNGFTQYGKNTVRFGVASYNVNYYMNNSFDLGFQTTIGDFGFCQTPEKAHEMVDVDERCGGCLGRVGMGNLNSRMYTAGILVKYKIANGYMIKEDAKVQPYVYFGYSVSLITDRMKKSCVVPGTYTAVTGGFGVRYNFCDRLYIGYNLLMGYFTSDELDFMTHDANDMYMQNSVVLGINLF